eukprot:CAMPEP_0184738870 /NCGR_PEP_ID=MMETSP0315-20130426/1612_1 /TAXON_ID=101924 /ORGANISM="Rhodosorus marinus, Strain UTEX LB 2760" /LENGTH=116 /DNA_ID=CAMNT_0027207033 /DNA_START=92 /DNA_END=442 /DNA_ORIENTATION=+
MFGWMDIPAFKRYVEKARDPRYLWATRVLLLGGLLGTGQLLMHYTTGIMVDQNELKKEMENSVEGRRQKRIADNSVAMILKAGTGAKEIEEGYEEIKIPQTIWHPKVEQESKTHRH